MASPRSNNGGRVQEVMEPDWVTELQSQPTVKVEVAARYYGISRGQAYKLAREGELPGCLRLGHRFVVRTAVLARILGVESRAP